MQIRITFEYNVISFRHLRHYAGGSDPFDNEDISIISILLLQLILCMVSVQQSKLLL